MYLSKLNFSPKEFSHQYITRGFTGKELPERAILYRVESDSTLVRSLVCPDWPDAYSAVVKPFVSPPIAKGSRFRFRLAFSPVIQSCGRRRECDPREWLAKRDIGADLTIPEDGIVTCYRKEKSSSKLTQFFIPISTVDGYLTVTDPVRLEAVIASGIGRERAYGCGLMSVVPVVNR